ncbi:AmmeMemoRadiSam system protein B [Aquisphaera insulae]|uniref:AmmeMemoRadiSam system protein B n=1 Tax=Aquisphaera insulae TaxID=2712864 RepID=UPI0013EC52BF|nr:AmmeMemoRadiSam system protein B [Aquisphaera insulae]
MRVRQPAVAGRFYEADPSRLRESIRRLLAEAAPAGPGRAEGLIVPHAGYAYSAPIAASGHAWLIPRAAEIDRVILLGTCHTAGVSGLAASSDDSFETPLGEVPVDRGAVARALEQEGAAVRDDAHARDHSLEVQLPFLQVVLDRFRIVPFLVGAASPAEVAGVLDAFWNEPGTIVVVSSDLSHYHDYEEARRLDAATARAIEGLEEEALGPGSACGRHAIAGLLRSARGRGLTCRTVDLRSSGDTAGRRDRVVGYGAFVMLAGSL